MQNIINWIEDWYRINCDGDWEHNYGIKIDTIDNPGWSVIIDLNETRHQDLNIKKVFYEKDKNDWYTYSIEDGKYKAFGSSQKLEFLLKVFQEIITKSHHP